MIELGNYNELGCLRHTAHGAFLGDQEGTEILLPSKYVPSDLQEGDRITVYCYLDGQERPVATTIHPLIIRGGFAYLEVVETHDFGAFVDWGLEKHLFVPYREQSGSLSPGEVHLFHCYMDEQSFRLAASMRYQKFTEPAVDQELYNKEVEILPARKTELGWESVVEQLYMGMLYFDRIYREIDPNRPLKGHVTKIREDGKLDLDLRKQGYAQVEQSVQDVFQALLENDGFLPLNDKSDPTRIQTELGMSKKTFKKALGWLYKKRCIGIEEEGIRLLQQKLPD